MSWEVLSINYGITYTVKNLTSRPRPFIYNPDAPMEVRTGSDSRESFYSGHVSTAAAMSFFMATVMSDYHPDMKTGIRIAIWTVAAAYPAITGYFRIAAGKHYRTDVIAAYAAGAFTGWLIPFLHKKKRSDSKFSFAPVNIQGNAGLYMSLKF
jgi:membrane-associated phospholipid phosphatase